jgi:hypothetical protein
MFLGGALDGGGGSVVQGSGVSGFGIAGQLVGGLFSGAGPVSFDGGGYTGVGVRSGGLDGKGGFPALLHPNETVIDHTKINQTMPAASQSEDDGSQGGSRNRLWASLEEAMMQPMDAPEPISNVSLSYDGPVLNFNSEEYVRKEDIPKIVSQSVKQSHGFTTSRLRDSPSYRRQAGVRG